MTSYRSLKYPCSNCGYENTIQVEVPKPRFGGRNPQIQAANIQPEPKPYAFVCDNCGKTNEVLLK